MVKSWEAGNHTTRGSGHAQALLGYHRGGRRGKGPGQRNEAPERRAVDPGLLQLYGGRCEGGARGRPQLAVDVRSPR